MTDGRQKAYEITFVVEPLDEDAADNLLDELPDAFVASHGQITTVDLQVAAVSGPVAAKMARKALVEAGAVPVRLDLGLVDRAAIAVRAGVTQQAVGAWVRGERGHGSPFPRPVTTAGATPAWSWAEVADWLVERGVIEPGPVYLTFDQIQYANSFDCDGWRDGPAGATSGLVELAGDTPAAEGGDWKVGGRSRGVASSSSSTSVFKVLGRASVTRC